MIECKDGRVRFVYEIDEEDIESLDEDFYNWLKEQGGSAMHDAISAYASHLNELISYYIDEADDGRWDCLKEAKHALDYRED